MAKRLNFKEILEMNGGEFELKISFYKDYIELHVWENECGVTVAEMFNVECNTSFNTKHEGINWNIQIPYENLMLIGEELSNQEKEETREFIDELLKKDEFFQELEEIKEQQKAEAEERKRIRELERERELAEAAERERLEQEREQSRWIRK